MRDELQIKANCIISSNWTNQIHFDYYDKEMNLVGSIIVDEYGRLEWHLLNKRYKDNLLNLVVYLNGDSDLSLELNLKRWQKAKILISNCGLYLNYEKEFLVDDEKKYIKK